MGARPAPWTADVPAVPARRNTSEDWLLDVVDAYLERGLGLKALVERLGPTRAYRETFDLCRPVNPPNRAYGWFDTATIDGRPMAAMGNVQQMFFDRTRSPRERFAERRQLREFVLRYFMRVSSFAVPDVYVGSAREQPASAWPASLSWCSGPGPGPREGFGFTQLFAKRAGSPVVEQFSPEDRFAIVDLRELGRTYDWLIAKVRIFDFAFRFSVGAAGFDVVVPLAEESYLVLSPELITDDPQEGRFGLGYAFIRNRDHGTLAYGPGEFEAAYEQIHFSIDDEGRVRVEMFFAANRPTAIARVSLDPVVWAARLMNVATLGLASGVIGSGEALYRRLGLTWPSVDPVRAFIALANAVTAGQAAGQACISTEQADRLFLAQHFKQHYEAIAGSIATWRQIADWTNDAALPDWVRTGRAS